MKREKLNALSEKDVIVGLIVSDKFCREIIPTLKPKDLEIEYTRIIASWIIWYYGKFKCAPKTDILKLYRSKIEEIKDEDLQENILSFIESVNKDFESVKNFNEEFMIQKSVQYLKSRSLKNLVSDIDSYVQMGDLQKAEETLTHYRKVEANGSDAISLLHDVEKIVNSFLDEEDFLYQMPGAYGKVIGKINRNDFIAFLAPIKRGKTWHLMYSAECALQAGLKVVYFSCEMSQEKMIKRFWRGLSGQCDVDEEGIDFPYFEENGQGKFIIKHKTINRKAVSFSDVSKKQKVMQKLFRGGDIRLFAVPTDSMTVRQMEMKLEDLIYDGYIPDVIVIDYADILAKNEEDRGNDYRNQLDGIWKRLRGLAQKLNVAIITASQSTRDTINKDVKASDVAEDMRKLAHVTAMVSLNQTPEEKQQNIMRVKQLIVREEGSEFKEAICLQSLKISCPVLDSKFEDEVELNSEHENPSTIGRRKRK